MGYVTDPRRRRSIRIAGIKQTKNLLISHTFLNYELQNCKKLFAKLQKSHKKSLPSGEKKRGKKGGVIQILEIILDIIGLGIIGSVIAIGAKIINN